MRKCLFLFFALTVAVHAVSSQTAEEYFFVANQYSIEGRFNEALAVLAKGLRRHPDNAMLHFGLGHLSYHLQNSALALRHLSRAIELDSSFALAYAIRARVFKSIHEYDRVLYDLNMAVYLEPENEDRYFHRAYFFYTVLRDFTRALADFNMAILLNPSYENFHNRGVFYTSVGFYEYALDDLNKAIQLNNEDIISWLRRGNVFLSLRRYHEAVSDFTEVIRINPNNRDVFYNRSFAHRELAYFAYLSGDLEQARYYLQRAQEDMATAYWLDSQR